MIEVFNDRQKTQKYQLYAYKCILYNVVRRLVLVKKRHIFSSNQSLENYEGKKIKLELGRKMLQNEYILGNVQTRQKLAFAIEIHQKK